MVNLLMYCCLQAISTPYTGYFWSGLEYNNGEALLDGSVNHDWWYYAIGSFSLLDRRIPGPAPLAKYSWQRQGGTGILVNMVELYAYVDPLANIAVGDSTPQSKVTEPGSTGKPLKHNAHTIGSGNIDNIKKCTIVVMYHLFKHK